MNAIPPRFGAVPLEEDDDLFSLKTYVCVDCKQPFQTSRHSMRCPMCRALRQGEVGAASVTCPVCDKEHRVPVLAPHRLCPPCASDLDATERHIRETLVAAEQAFDDATTRWDAVWAQADPNDRARFHVVDDARLANAPGFAAKYQKALDRGDGLSTLLRAKEACDEVAARVQGRLAVWAGLALEEVREARHAS